MAKKIEEKDVKNNKKDEKTKKVKKTKKEKKNVKKESFFEGVRSEMSKVKWPTKKEVLKYTIATLVFMIVLVLFFVLLTLLMSLIREGF